MQAITYYIALPFLYLVSVLPFRVLYLISDGIYGLLYHVVGYRRKVVLENMRRSFPEKSEAELERLCRQFYRYFCDLVLESFKTLTISREAMLRHCRMQPEALELFSTLAEQNKSVIIVMGHKGNWEWAGNTFSLCCRHHLYVIYHPLSNKYFNGLLYRMRTRFGTGLIAMKDTFREMARNRQELTATAFIADQSPSPEKAWWMDFLHQDTAVFMGTEKIAQKLGFPVVYVSVNRVKRGFYTLGAEMLTQPPYAAAEGDITMAHTRRLEKDIIQEPQTWLWTHRRWKHRRVLNKKIES